MTSQATPSDRRRGSLVEGRLHLAAYALGIGASGMTFLDSEIPALLGEPLAGLLFTCVSVPFYWTKRAGTPRALRDFSASPNAGRGPWRLGGTGRRQA